ncbi:MAG: hypothetical protein AAF367_19200 [Pseudomonadota bacterium]
MIFRKPNPDFVRAQGIRYDGFFEALHRQVYLDWYMEIGCRRGRSVKAVDSKTIVIDPYFRITSNVIGNKPQFIAQQMESDAFFDSGFLQSNGIRVSFCFIDGMHLIENALRDFINVERNADPKGAIAVHDCCPFSIKMTTRNLAEHEKGPWTGDVWKLIPVLQRWRPDLKLDVLDCRKTGLLVASNLNPQDTTLDDSFDEIMAEFREMPLESFGVRRFFDSFEYVSAEAVIQGRFGFLDAVRRDAKDRLSRSKVSP